MGKKVKIGKFRLTQRLVEGEWERAGELLAKLKFVPVDVRYHYDLAEYEYLGFSPFFDEIEKGIKAPQYDVVIAKVRYEAVEQVEVERLDK